MERLSKAGKLWLAVSLIQLSIYSTLGISPAISSWLRGHNLLNFTFWGLMVSGLAVAGLYCRKYSSPRNQMLLIVSFILAYFFLLVRISLPEERTHLIEYTLVGVLVYRAITESYQHRFGIAQIALLSFLVTSLFGLIDECLQCLMPSRVFDPIDIAFNCIATFLAVSISVLYSKLSRKS